MGPVLLSVAWLGLGLVVGSRWLMILPISLALAVLVGAEIGDLNRESGVGRALVYLGGDYEFWWSTYLFGLPWFLLLIELGVRVHRRITRPSPSE